MRGAEILVAAAIGLSTVAAAAQDSAQTEVGGGYAPIGPFFFLAQTDDVNVAGIVQTSIFPEAEVIQTGFYNRAVIAQSGTDPIATVDQLGDFNRSLILQLEGNTDALTVQDGRFNTAIVLQTGLNNTSSVNQNGDVSTAFQFQDNGTVFSLSQGDLERLASNFIFAPETARAAVEVVNLDGIAFSDSLFAHFDQSQKACLQVPVDIKTDPADRVGACDPFRIWASIEYSGGSQEDRLGAMGFDYDTGAVLLGGEYSFTPDLVGGIALRYAHSSADVSYSLATIDVDSYGGAVYADYRPGQFFLSGVATVSQNDVEIDRPGFDGSVGAEPDGQTYGAALQTGYLFDASLFQIGPIASLSYTKSELDGYSESGDFLLNQTVPDQDAETLLGMLGIRLAVERDMGDNRLKAHADIGYEHDFNDDEFRVLETRFEFAPDAAIYTPLSGLGEQDYLKLAGGLSVTFASKAELSLSAQARLLGDDRESFRVGGALSYPF